MDLALMELKRLLDADYAVAFRAMNGRSIGVRAVKNGKILEARADNIEDAMHSIFAKFKELTLPQDKAS